jgi:hypothetical protein
VPQVLATDDQAFVMRHLGRPGEEAPSLSNAIEEAIARGAQPTLELWQKAWRPYSRHMPAARC